MNSVSTQMNLQESAANTQRVAGARNNSAVAEDNERSAPLRRRCKLSRNVQQLRHIMRSALRRRRCKPSKACNDSGDVVEVSAFAHE